MALIELNESVEDLGFDKFRPKADQSKFVSGFFVEGQHGNVEGFAGELDMAQRQRIPGSKLTHDGWRRYEGKDGQPHRVVHNGFKINGLNLVEMIRPIDDAQDTQKVQGQMSQSRIDNELNLTRERLERAGIKIKDGENELRPADPSSIAGFENETIMDRPTQKTFASAEVPTSKSRMWTPERKAAQAARMKERHAQKKATQTQS